MKKITLDENMPRPLKNLLAGHMVTIVQKEGWAGIENGDLIALVDVLFDVLAALQDRKLRC